MTIRCSLALIALLLTQQVLGDVEQTNDPVIAAGDSGTCYAKSVPNDNAGKESITTVYQVRRERDEPSEIYYWYARNLFVLCNIWRGNKSETTVVRIGPWARGFEANDDDLAIAFYVASRLVKRYTTLDIAGSAGNVFATVSHYSVFEYYKGFERQDNGTFDFVAVDAKGKEFRFSAETGELRRELTSKR